MSGKIGWGAGTGGDDAWGKTLEERYAASEVLEGRLKVSIARVKPLYTTFGYSGPPRTVWMEQHREKKRLTMGMIPTLSSCGGGMGEV